jgi:hypothetical protein
MLRYVIAGCALVWATAGHAAENERKFAARLLPQLQAAAPDWELRVSADDPLTIELTQGDGQTGTINLHRIYGFCQNAMPEECDQVASEFVSRISAERPEPTAADLRVIVRDQEYVDHVVRTLPDGNRPPHRQIGDDLFAILAFDSPDTIALANEESLRALGLEGAAAWQLAEAQTKAILPPFPDGAGLAQNAVAFQEYEYLPSMLADTDAWRAIALAAGPDLFVTAVSDRFVFVAVLPDGPNLEEFKQVVREDCAAQERCISPNIYRFRDGRWVIAN